MSEARTDPAPRRGGRARDPELDHAITDATRALLLEHGLYETTIEAIARRAGVARATVYRRWSNIDALVVHFVRGLAREFHVLDRGAVRAELIELLEAQLRDLQREVGNVYPRLGGRAMDSPSGLQAVAEVMSRRRAALVSVLERGRSRGEIRADFDLELALALLWGPLYYRFLESLCGHQALAGDFIECLVDSVLRGIGAGGGEQGAG